MTERHDTHQPPAHETREETLARVRDQQRAIYPESDASTPERPCTTRGFGLRLVHWVLGTTLLGAAAGLTIPLALGAGIGQAIIWAVSLAVVLGCTVPLIVTEREDGWRSRARVPKPQAHRRG